jgi:hypothetical protein
MRLRNDRPGEISTAAPAQVNLPGSAAFRLEPIDVCPDCDTPHRFLQETTLQARLQLAIFVTAFLRGREAILQTVTAV